MKLPHATLLILLLLTVQSALAKTVTVMNNNDSGVGSLRHALDVDTAPGDTINFDPAVTGTITLTSDELHVGFVNIAGPGAKILTISGNNTFRVFDCAGTNYISGLTISQGLGTAVSRPDGLVGFGGGGLVLQLGASLTISNCAISANRVLEDDDASGGGIYNVGTLTVIGSTISSNSVTGFGHYNTGGGIYNIGILTLNNCTFSGNLVTNTGGGATTGGAVYNDTFAYPHAPVSGYLYIKSCTFDGNSVINPNYALPYGGAIDNTVGGPVGITMFQNTIVAGNFVNGGVDVVRGMQMQSQGFNFIAAADPFNALLPSDQTGTVAAPINPKLSPLQNNGGPTLTMRPLSMSPVINSGNSAGLTSDQRGFSRPFIYPVGPANVPGGDGSDIGAVELNTPPLGYQYNIAMLAWPTNYLGFLAETANQLSPSAWTLLPGTPAIVGGQYVLSTGPATNNSQFFRLALGNAGAALSFDGVGAYVSIGVPTPVPTPWTAEFWVNRQDATDYSATLLGDASTALKLEQFDFTRQVGFTQFGVADYTFNYSAPTNTWVHLAFVSDTTTRLYVNGVLQDTLPVTIPLPLGRIGYDSSGFTDHLRGIVDEVRVWNVARTQAQILSNMNHSLPLPQSNLVGYWKFDKGSGMSTADSSALGRTGTLQNTPVWVDSTAPILP